MNTISRPCFTPLMLGWLVTQQHKTGTGAGRGKGRRVGLAAGRVRMAQARTGTKRTKFTISSAGAAPRPQHSSPQWTWRRPLCTPPDPSSVPCPICLCNLSPCSLCSRWKPPPGPSAAHPRGSLVKTLALQGEATCFGDPPLPHFRGKAHTPTPAPLTHHHYLPPVSLPNFFSSTWSPVPSGCTVF